MERALIPARQVTPAVTRKWCVLVQVIERRKPRTKPNGPLYRNHVVTDMKGTKVCIMLYGKMVNFFAHTLQPYKRYYVSNATVKDTPQNYRYLEYPYTWTLYRTNLVEEYPEPIPPTLPCTFVYDRMSDMYQYADQDNSICVKALVIHTLPVQASDNTSSYRDCVIINEEKIPMIMRVWEDVQFDTEVNVYTRYNIPTLIIAYGLKVITQHGLSLRTKASAYIMENPPLNEHMPLKDWYTAHAAEIIALVEKRAYRNPAYLFHPPRPAEIQPLSFAVSAIDNVKTIWTEGTLTFLPGQVRLWFEACEKCLTELDVDIGWRIMCSYCKEYTNVTVCSRISVFLNHGHTTVEATIQSPETEKLLPFTGNDLRIAAIENKPLTKQVEAALEKKHVICFMKYYEQENRGLSKRCYPLVKIYTEAEVHEHEMTQQRKVLAEAISEDVAPPPHIGSSSSAATTTTEKQMFTPTIKEVLEEVHETSVSQLPQTNEAVGAKRILTFEGVVTDPHEDSTTKQPEHVLASLPESPCDPEHQTSSSAANTPTKKPRGKEKET